MRFIDPVAGLSILVLKLRSAHLTSVIRTLSSLLWEKTAMSLGLAMQPLKLATLVPTMLRVRSLSLLHLCGGSAPHTCYGVVLLFSQDQGCC